MKKAGCQGENVVGNDTWQWEGWSGEASTTPTEGYYGKWTISSFSICRKKN